MTALVVSSLPMQRDILRAIETHMLHLKTCQQYQQLEAARETQTEIQRFAELSGHIKEIIRNNE